MQPGNKQDNQNTPSRQLWRVYTNHRVLTVLVLGFASGLPLALTASTLQAWYTVANVDTLTIGFLTLVGLPYVWKFLWAPFMDRFLPLSLDRRRGWMLVTQVILMILLVIMGFGSPAKHPVELALIALAVAFTSASQDIAINAYQTDVLREEERGVGAAMAIGGYRVAMLVSGGIALMLAGHLGWRLTYFIMAACMGIGFIASLQAPAPEEQVSAPSNLQVAIIEPFKDFFSRQGLKIGLALLIFIILYKIGDAFTLSFSSTFLLRGVGFTLTQVGVINKFMAVLGIILGALVGGGCLSRWGLYKSLWIFGILQAVSNLGFMWLALVGRNFYLAGGVVLFEYFCGGLATAAFLAFIMALCNKRFSATQFALLSSLSAVGRVMIGPFAGWLVEWMSWSQFYFWGFVLSLPGLLLLWKLRTAIRELNQHSHDSGS